MSDPGYSRRQRRRDSDDYYGRNTEEFHEEHPCLLCGAPFEGPGLLCRRCRRENGNE